MMEEMSLPSAPFADDQRIVSDFVVMDDYDGEIWAKPDFERPKTADEQTPSLNVSNSQSTLSYITSELSRFSDHLELLLKRMDIIVDSYDRRFSEISDRLDGIQKTIDVFVQSQESSAGSARFFNRLIRTGKSFPFVPEHTFSPKEDPFKEMYEHTLD